MSMRWTYLGTDLVPALAGLHVHYLSHLWCLLYWNFLEKANSQIHLLIIEQIIQYSSLFYGRMLYHYIHHKLPRCSLTWCTNYISPYSILLKSSLFFHLIYFFWPKSRFLLTFINEKWGITGILPRFYSASTSRQGRCLICCHSQLEMQAWI